MLNFDPRRKMPELLMVDDDLVSREVTATMLIMSGYNVHAVASGEEALSMLTRRACSPDVILMDAQMPGLSGVALIAAFRQRSKASLYVVSASQPPSELLSLANGFIQKPFGAEQVKLALASLEGRSPAEDAELMDPSLPVVSAETLAQLRVMMKPKAVHEVYMAVIIDLQRRAKSIHTALKRADFAEVARLGHAVKGGCGMAGALQAARLGALLENLPDQPAVNQLDNGRKLLAELEQATERLERMLEAELTI
jgi:CheY-like chemotaxis protein